ncbi:MAG TPA: TolC family protein [Micropepsaceae bacterium]|nr:TolC family protein [Micropepsaceae bacterium]
MIQPGGKIITALAALLACGPLLAESETNSAGPRLTLADVARLVGDRNPRLLAERETVAAARADRRIAGAYPNPKLSFDHFLPGGGEHTIFTGDRQEQIAVEIPLLIPGQRSSRIAKADADIAAAQAHVAAGTGVLAGDASLSFMRLLAFQEKTAVISNAFADVTHLKDAVAGRLAEGAASAYDLTRVEVELGVVGSRLEGARSESAAESAQLASLLGLTNGLPAAAGLLQPWELQPGILYDSRPAAFDTPAVVAATRDVAAAEAGIKAAKRNRWPELSVGVGHTWTQHPFGAADFFGLNIEIPIFDTRLGQVDKARSDARAAEARRNAVSSETEAALRQLAETVRRRQAALDRDSTDIEPRLAHLKQMAADAYALGRHTLLESLDAEQARREVTLEHIETVTALVEAQIRYLAATGRLLPYLAPPNSPIRKP